MRFLGFDITRAKPRKKALSPVDNRGGWWPVIRESLPGAWQANVTVTMPDALQYWAFFRSVSLISSDIGKLVPRLMDQNADGIMVPADTPAFSPVLRKPNEIQNRIQFYANWMESKLTRGNTYVLKVRDSRDVVRQLKILDPNRVEPLVSEAGEVFYRLNADNVAGILQAVTVPAEEIIHDRWNTLYHPLVGLSPIYAAGINALAGLRMEQSSARLWANGARPSVVLEAPGSISDPAAARIKAYWEENFTGENVGKVAVLGDGLVLKPFTMTAEDAQLIEHLKWNDSTIFGCFGIPAFMGNAAASPALANVEALSQQYYSQCLQIHLEGIELALDEGLGLPDVKGHSYRVQFDLRGLLRMDTPTKVKTAVEGLKGLFKPNEVRAWFDLAPVAGGDDVYLQQQNFSVSALKKRDSKADPFATSSGAGSPPAADPPEAEDEEPDDEAARMLAGAFERGLAA